jgi:hypothetical protein
MAYQVETVKLIKLVRVEVFTAVTMKNVVSWNMKPQFVLHRRHCVSATELSRLMLEKNGVFWVVTPCGSCKNRRFGGTWRLLHQGDKNR